MSVPGPAKSLWLAEALAGAEEAPPLGGDERADVGIVGGGYTGLWTALELKRRQPSLDVALLEADVCGAGASGRNGGFVLSWWAKFGSLAKLCGDGEALRLARASAQAVAEIGAFCAEHGIDCHYRPDGWMWTATSPAQVGAWRPLLHQLEGLGERPFLELSAEEVARRTGSDRHLAGVFEPSAATVQPALLARGLRRVALERGVRIFERSPVLRLQRSRPPRLHTAQGSLSAERVVLATGAWSARIRELRRTVAVIASDVVATAPAPERLRACGWTDGLCISDSRMLVNYYRTTLDGRVVFGKGGGALAFAGQVGARFDGPSPRAAAVERCLRELYPGLADVPVAASWTGPIDRSLTGLPFFGRLRGRPDLLYGLGYSGNGVGPCLLGGRILASLVLDQEDEWSSLVLAGGPAGLFPPEPVRYLGGLLVRRAVEQTERAEDAGRPPNPVAARIAALAPAGLVPTKRR
jgi:putative aminophosphonate oxidoreductase